MSIQSYSSPFEVTRRRNSYIKCKRTMSRIYICTGHFISQLFADISCVETSSFAELHEHDTINYLPLCTTQWVKNCATKHSFRTLTNVGRFSEFFRYCIPQEICNKTYATLRNICVAPLSCET